MFGIGGMLAQITRVSRSNFVVSVFDLRKRLVDKTLAAIITVLWPKLILVQVCLSKISRLISVWHKS